jgi:hypothetical protein
LRFITTPIHGVMDYVMGILLVSSPYLFGFATGGPEQWLPIVLGIVLLLQSMMTRYELGLLPVISIPVHIRIDLANGLLLAASPWLFGFADQVCWPHLILGLIEIGAACCTETKMAVRSLAPAGM